MINNITIGYLFIGFVIGVITYVNSKMLLDRFLISVTAMIIWPMVASVYIYNKFIGE